MELTAGLAAQTACSDALTIRLPQLSDGGWGPAPLPTTAAPCDTASDAPQISKQVPTELGMNASPNRAAIKCWARQPVQCAGTITFGASAAKSSRTRGMSGSKNGPLRWKPPITAWIGCSWVRRRAYRQMFTMPGVAEGSHHG